MAGWIRKTAILGAILVFLSAGFSEGKTNESKKAGPEKNLAAASNLFGFRLFQKVVDDNPSENTFISPMSVSYALAMTLNGAGGKTLEAITSTLGLGDIPPDDINDLYRNLTSYLTGMDPAVKFEIANSIWYRQALPVSDTFINLNRDNFDARIQSLDFNSSSAAKTINDWVNEKTHGKIQNIVSPPIDPSTIMFLINAIYFKGSWKTPFDPVATRDHPFYRADGRETKCRMMFNTSRFEYFENDLFQTISLPYGNNGFSMIVFLPRPSVTVDDLIDRLDPQSWAIWQKSFYRTEVELGLPRFKFEYEITMNDILTDLGMGIAFDADGADFMKMVKPGSIPDRNIFISQVKHKTFLQVDEEGTEAAAVTSVTMALTEATMSPPPPPVMIVERPFLFAIQEKMSGSVVFIGKVVDPVWED